MALASGRRYEVLVQRGGRWMIDGLASSEIDAVARAEELFGDDTVLGVRVVRGRFNHAGVSFETTIFERQRNPSGKPPPVRLAAAPDAGMWCDGVDELYGPASRRAIGRMLRGFLDQLAITPTELLHHHRYMRLLERQDGLLSAAVQRVATQQARARGTDPRARAAVLDGFVAAITKRAKEVAASRGAALLAADGLTALAEAVAALTRDEGERHFLLRYAVSLGLEDKGGFADKLEHVAGLAVADLPPALRPLVDELMAGLLASATVIQDMLGYKPHLGAALVAVADLALGRHDGTGSNAPPALASLARLCGEAAMPETRIVLLERLERELASDRPLCRGDAAEQRRLLEPLLDRLVDDRGLVVGGAAMIEAIARRSRRLDVIGGMEAVRFADGATLGRLAQLLDLEKRMLAARQQQALATYMVELLETYDGDPAALLPLAPRLAATRLPTAAKRAVLERLPQPATADRG